jgi:hypothetical protein
MAVQTQTNNLALIGLRCSRLTAIKTEPKPTEFRPTGEYPGHSPHSTSRGVPSNVHDPYQLLSDYILNFFYPRSQSVAPESSGMNLYFSPDNIRDFLNQYTHFHIHTPVLHLPTFRILEAYTGLVAAMCCIGACYSERVDADDVRQMMDFLWSALERDCTLLGGSSVIKDDHSQARNYTEQLQAVLITAILNLWNGTPHQRERARQTFPLLANEAARLGFLKLSNESLLYSPLHHVKVEAIGSLVGNFDWEAWLEQERRVRLMMAIFLGDVAMGLFFNMSSRIDPLELQIPLPCDDAAWDAKNPEDCLSALGLRGAEAAQDVNPYGTQRATQPEMHWALRALLHSSLQIQPGSTNLFGKFLLIHALMIKILQGQLGDKLVALGDRDTPPPHDWVVPFKTESGRATPVTGAGQEIEPQSLKALSVALDKFKYCWDVDMVSQFPPASQAGSNPQRSGFSRDGVHFYWLAKYILKHTNSEDLRLPADARFIQVISLLKSVKSWVMTDGAARGEELGSIGKIDENYGTMDLTLDLAKLFTPLPEAVGDTGVASVKLELGNMGG